jgi:hypothetical protein
MTVIERYAEAYLTMAKEADYRPAAPGDGCGGIYLSPNQLADPKRLQDEALKYAKEFAREEDAGEFYIGCADYLNNRAFVYTIEAAHCLCAGSGFRELASKLLSMAVKEMAAVQELEGDGRNGGKG